MSDTSITVIYHIMSLTVLYVQWNLCNPTPEFSRHPVSFDKIYGTKVFLLTK